MEWGTSDGIFPAVKPDVDHHQLCTIELIAAGHAERCPGEECVFWEKGCALARIEYELEGRPDVARLLVDLRRELELGREPSIEEVRTRFARLLNEDEHIFETGNGIF
ncbi:MAG TPA: hypothetical protein VLA22_10405 [Gaiellaceae bacterium]|nr:hypothetical protein [Gaiellaceae bacterium]